MGGLFGKKRPPPQPELPPLRWLAAADNPWQTELLDLREIALGWTSATGDPARAECFSRMTAEDGACFGEAPNPEPRTEVDLRYPTRGPLAEGILFSPREMEDKWAIFFYGGRILAVRSWTAEVKAVALTRQEEGCLRIHAIHGSLSLEPLEAAFDFLIRSHALNLVYPAPLQDPVTPETPLLYFSLFGRRAQFAARQRPAGEADRPLRTITRLHLACVRGQAEEARARLDEGLAPDLPGERGNTPLHWAVVGGHPALVRLLLERGCSPEVATDDGTTPLMAAVQQRNLELVQLLLECGARAGPGDGRGFTALHRAAEMGQTECVELLLAAGADPRAEAEGHSPLSLARREGHAAIVAALEGGAAG